MASIYSSPYVEVTFWDHQWGLQKSQEYEETLCLGDTATNERCKI